jgi:sugar (pentulose or hexulose) kinase
MTKYTLVIDLGSTEFKAAIYADNVRLHGSAAHKLSYNRNCTKVELPVESALKAFSEIIRGAIKSAGIELNEISSIGVTSQAQTFAVADENGRFLTPFISWLDMRASETYKTITLENFAEHSSITEIQPNMQICILKHLLDEEPEIAREKIKVIPLPAYLIMLLTGKCASDNNIAAMSGIFSLKENDYWQPALDLLGMNSCSFPDIVEIGDIAGTASNDNPFEIPAGIPVFSCGNDQTAGAFGAGLQVDDMLITLGTAQTVYRCCKNMPDGVQFRGNYPDGLYYAMSAGTGGDLITKAIEKIPEFKDFETFAELAAKADIGIDAGLHVENDEIVWRNDHVGLPEKALSVLNFLADEIGDFVEQVAGNTKRTKTIFVSGGGVKNRIWLELIGSKINKKLLIKHISPCHGVAKMLQIKHN